LRQQEQIARENRFFTLCSVNVDELQINIKLKRRSYLNDIPQLR